MKKFLLSGVFLVTLLSFGFTKDITLDELKNHNSAKSCWSVINDKVYDLTSFIGEHPGGTGAILKICGTDGTKTFMSKHGTGAKFQTKLDSFLLGDIVKKEDKKMCTMDYTPVCGKVEVQCIKAPCNPVYQTFSNKCTLEQNKSAKFEYQGECKTTITGSVSTGNLTLTQKKSVDKFLSGLYTQLDKNYEYGSDKVDFLTKILNNVEKALNTLESSKSGNKVYLKTVLMYIKSALNDKIQSLDLRI